MPRLLRWIFPGFPRRRLLAQPRPSRLLLEPLEVRELLSSQVFLQITASNPPPTNYSYAGVGFQQNVLGFFSAQVNYQPDNNPNDFKVQIQWGDGKTSTGELALFADNGSVADFYIKGSHVYAQPGSSYTITASVTGTGSASGGSVAPTTIDDATVSAMPSGLPGIQPQTAKPTQPLENVSLSIIGSSTPINTAIGDTTSYTLGTVYATVNGGDDINPNDFHAYINWGDSSAWHPAKVTFAGYASPYPQAKFTLSGSPPPYMQAGDNFPLMAYVTGPDGTSLTGQLALANVATAFPLPTLKGNPSTLTAFEGSKVPLASFADSHSPSSLQVGIRWDGSSSSVPGTIKELSTGKYEVYGILPKTLTPGQHTAAVTLSNLLGSKSQIEDTFNVIPLPQTAGAILSLTEGKSSGPVVVATFKPLPGDSNLTSATIHWGDSKPTSSGKIVSDGHGGFKILGTHTYAEDGTYHIQVALNDPNGLLAPVASTAHVAEGALKGQGSNLTGVVGVPQGKVVLAVFHDEGAPEPAADYHATISWNGVMTTGTVLKVGANDYEVLGTAPSQATHDYRGTISLKEDTAHLTIPFTDDIKKFTLESGTRTPTTIDLGWTDVAALGYKLYALASTKPPQDISTTAWGSPIYTGTKNLSKALSLLPNTTYDFRVVADLGNGKTATAVYQTKTT